MDGGALRQLQVDSIELQGGDRRVDLQPGVNVVLGPMASGKSTFVKLMRALFTSVPSDLPPEAQQLPSLRATCHIGGAPWNILRRLTTTDTSLVEIVGATDTILAPARRATGAHPETFSDWLLTALDLPKISVPAAPSRPESEPTPVTFADFFNYCVLRGDEIDSSVFGHRDPFRDIKRKYVFEIAYGLFDSSQAELQTDLRAIEAELTFLRGEAAAATRIFVGTELESIETVRVAREERLGRLQYLVAQEVSVSHDARTTPIDTELRSTAQRLSDELASTRARLADGRAQLADLSALVDQLRSQGARLTRAAAAGEALVDFEFIICPRCGNPVTDGRSDGENCLLCLQVPPPSPHPDELRKERDRIEEQIVDTLDLIDGRRSEIDDMRQAVERLETERALVGARLDEAMGAFVSDRQSEIAEMASERSRIEAEISKYDQYLVILQRAEDAGSRIAQLSERRLAIRQELDDASKRLRIGQSNVGALEERFYEYLQRLRIPTFDLPLSAAINMNTYLPVVSGRPFETLSSQGLQVLVNVAHALAHHTVAIDRDLPLPGMLIIDGASSNVGTEGYDAERLEDMYELLADVGEAYGDQLQIIIVDNHIPSRGQDWVRLTLSEDDRLIHFPSGKSQPSAA